jgi:hypothetical protein
MLPLPCNRTIHAPQKTDGTQQNEKKLNVQSQDRGFSVLSRVDTSKSAAPVSLRANGALVQREAEAEDTERMVSRALQSEMAMNNERPAMSQVNTKEIVDKVYRLMLYDLLFERERGALLK